MNTIDIKGHITIRRAENAHLWILINDHVKDKAPVFSANLVEDQADYWSKILHDGDVIALTGSIAGADRRNGFVVVYDPVITRAYREEITLVELPEDTHQ